MSVLIDKAAAMIEAAAAMIEAAVVKTAATSHGHSRRIKPSYLSLSIFLYHFIIFLYLISLLLYQRHDIDLFFIVQGPSYTGLKAMMLN
jgi:hypothetical protein